MEWTYENLIRAREIVAGLLDQLELDAYLFGVEPKDERWEVRVEYAATDGWRTSTIMLDDDSLLASSRDPAGRRKALDSFRQALVRANRVQHVSGSV
jgi:hypothetical protein